MGLVKVRTTEEDFSLVSDVPHLGRQGVHAKVTTVRIKDVAESLAVRRRAKQDWRPLINSWLMHYKLTINMRTMRSGPCAVTDKRGHHSTVAGTTRTPPLGIKTYKWLPQENRLAVDWATAEIDNSDRMPPAVFTANGLVYIANKREDICEYFAADWEAAEKEATWRFPEDSVPWNNWSGITVFLPNGDFLLGGFFSIKRFDTGAMHSSLH